MSFDVVVWVLSGAAVVDVPTGRTQQRRRRRFDDYYYFRSQRRRDVIGAEQRLDFARLDVACAQPLPVANGFRFSVTDGVTSGTARFRFRYVVGGSAEDVSFVAVITIFHVGRGVDDPHATVIRRRSRKSGARIERIAADRLMAAAWRRYRVESRVAYQSRRCHRHIGVHVQLQTT